MKKIALILIALLLLTTAAYAQDNQEEETGLSVAVICAVEFYSNGWAWRPDAINDANKIAWILSNHDFKVIRLYGHSATEKGIFDALEKAESMAGQDGSVMFYFSGHGIHPKADPKGDYIVPYGAAAQGEVGLINIERIKSEVVDYVRAENSLFIFDTGSTLSQPNMQHGTILELATALKKGLSGSADYNNNGRVEFYELAKSIGPKVKNVKIHARNADEIILSEDEVIVKSTRLPKKKRHRKTQRERMRNDQFDRLFEQRLEDKMRKIEEMDQKMQDIDNLMDDPSSRLPFPR